MRYLPILLIGFCTSTLVAADDAPPNIDRLAAEGMRFTQFYNNAKCTTTRASWLAWAELKGVRARD